MVVAGTGGVVVKLGTSWREKQQDFLAAEAITEMKPERGTSWSQ